ncbi:hypothetical protein MHU86_10904 [Fragilaria crotonensis]|nr:hypothetical protein MHU86_10904 [Fragilaria crotonensis]
MAEQSRDVRYKYDMQQAELMSRNLSKPASASLQTIQNVELGLQGLEDAERLANQGSLDEALKAYELSIELLLKCLKAAGANQDMIRTRVKVALGEAEALKAQIATGKKKSRKEPKTAAAAASSTTPTPVMWEHLSTKLSSAIDNMSKSSPTKLPVSTRPSPDKGDSSTVASAGPQRSRRSRLDYDKDPLVQQVKNDLYIDSSELQHTTWNDIAGLAKAKQSLKESAILPLLRPDLFSGLRKPQNILLYGPPGTGKTLLVKAVAYESQCLLFSCSASTLTSKWHGEGEKLVRTLFKVAADVAPSLIFIDEMDALLSSRNDTEHEASRRFKTEFMVQMDGLTGNSSANGTNVLVVGCTNCPWNVDDAILRRFPRRILIPLPDIEARIVLLQKLLEKAGKHSITSSRQIKQLAERLEGCSGSDISAIAAEASFGPIRSLSPSKLQTIAGQDQLRPISMQDFEEAMADSTKSVSPALLKRYADWERQQQTK